MISHSLYADDVLFMGEWFVVNTKNLSRILKCFQMASGLKVNFHKSVLIGLGTSTTEEDLMVDILRCKKGKTPFCI